MERINTLLDKIKELNNRQQVGIIDVDLMMDYTRIIYADLLEWRSRMAFNDAVSLDQPETTKGPVQALEENHTELETRPDIIAPAVELDTTSSAYESLKPAPAPPPPAMPLTRSYDKDIRKQISINDKYQFISELFGNDREAYEEVVSEINNFETEEEALDWLGKTTSPRYGWQEDMEAVQSFYQAISTFFNSK